LTVHTLLCRELREYEVLNEACHSMHVMVDECYS
jgi:hypothetical protein